MYLGGRVLTMDPGHPEAEAVAVLHGMLVAVGSDDEVLPWSHLDGGASMAHLARERDAAREIIAAEAPDEGSANRQEG